MPDGQDRTQRGVAICVLTLHRPLGLSNLLDALANIDDPGASYAVSLVVVDNDAGQSAKATVSDYQNDRYRWPLSYVCEPVRGIPFARNRALAAAAGSEFIVFVDDDEVPDRGWLHELLRVQRETGADVVEGRVDSVFASPPAKWITNSGLFVRPRRRTGEELAAATTSNVLFNAAIVPANEPAFDERMRFTGGSDTHFFMSARLAGHRIVWADDAIVTETVPATRATLGWLLRREYRRGNTLSVCLRELEDSWPRRLKRLGHVASDFATGLAMFVAAPVRGGMAGAAQGLHRLVHGAGLLTGLFNVRYEEYRVVHGT